LRRAEELGFDSIWVQEQLLGRDPSLEPVVSLAFAAASTSRVRLGTATIVAPLRNPVHLAKSLATIDQLSHGRLVAGLSIGEVRAIYETIGVSMSTRTSRLEELIAAMRSFWLEPSPSFNGAHWSFESAPMEPKPVQKPGPPIWLGSHARVGINRAARIADGWIGAGGSSMDDFADRVTWLNQALDEHDRDRSEFTIAKKLYVAVDDDPKTAIGRLADWFAIHWPPKFDPRFMAERVGIAGTGETLRAAVGRVAALGADLAILNPVFDESEHLERFATILADQVPSETRGGTV
jgi:probable F420-dependent oxidoreductase